MWYLVIILASFMLLAVFFALTSYETKHGVRFIAASRTSLDKHVERVEFILAHVDLGSFLYGEVRHLVSKIGHDIVHVTLVSVRAVERVLTRVIRRQHVQNEATSVPVESAREYVKTLSEFKEQLDATHPDVRDISE